MGVSAVAVSQYIWYKCSVVTSIITFEVVVLVVLVLIDCVTRMTFN